MQQGLPRAEAQNMGFRPSKSKPPTRCVARTPQHAARRSASMASKIPPLLSEKLQRKQNDKGCSCKLHIGENPEMKCGQFFVASDGTPQNKRRDHPTPALLDPPAACLRASLSAMSAEASAKTSGSSSLMLFAMEVLVFML